jgi:hypothetical protein
MPAERRTRVGARIRLWTLLALLGGTLLYAGHEVRSRRARTEWQRPVQVAVALVQLDSVEPEAVDALRARVPSLEARLAAEYHRYGGQLERPISCTVFGPVSVDRAPPDDPDDGIASLALHAYRQWRWTRAIDRAADLPWARFDSRIYVVVRSPHDRSRSLVEGSSELGGRVGVARIELDSTTVDLALFVVTHELFHTLGANDEYDANGRALIPAGLVEPDRVPLYPQRFAEVMTRNLVIAPGNERPPDSLAELGVGSVTAREIGWSSSTPSK